MYKPSNRLISKGIIPNRQPYFNERAYEYTFVSPGSSTVFNAAAQSIDAQKIRGVRYKIYEDRPIMVIIGYSWKLELFRSNHLDNNESYIAFFSRWESTGNILGLGDHMNQIFTAVEMTLLSFDPLVWVRELYDHPHVTNGIMSRPEIWEADVPDKYTTREAAAEKKMSEYYLADMFNSIGFQAFGGTPYAQANNIAPNPLIEKRVRDNEERAARVKEEEIKKAEEKAKQKKFCGYCGCELPIDAKFCTKCGSPVKPTLEEKKEQEKTLKSFPPFFIVSAGEPLEPYIHSRLDDDMQIVQEPQDHAMTRIQLAGLEVYRKPKGADRYGAFYSSTMNRDNELYVSDARLVFLNRKYNKDEAGRWIGFGGLTAMMVAQGLDAVEKGIKAAQRKGKALTGHIRYEWIANLYFHHKAKTLDHEKIRIIYEDLEHTLWNVNYIFTNETDAEDLANFILKRACQIRYSMLDKKDAELTEFLETYRNGNARIPVNPDPDKMSGVSFPYHYYATKGWPYLPD